MTVSINRPAMLCLLLLFATVSQAEALYLTQMKQAQWSAQRIDEVIVQLKQHKPVELAESLKVTPFHHQPITSVQPNRDFCISCHTRLPHTKNERLRSYLNMHVNYLTCASCHFQPDDVELVYRWHQWEDASGQVGTSALSLITPFYQQGAETLTVDHPEIAELLASWKVNDVREKAQLHLQLHTPLHPEGVNCPACHTNDRPLFDYTRLGFDDDETKLITDNRIARYLGDESFKDKPIKLLDLLQ